MVLSQDDTEKHICKRESIRQNNYPIRLYASKILLRELLIIVWVFKLLVYFFDAYA